jgi:tight adherence protein C
MTLSFIATLVAVFGSVALGVGWLTSVLLARTAPERRRLHRAGQVASMTGVFLENPTLTAEPSAFAKRMSSVVPRSPKEMSKLQRRLVRAGHTSPTSLAVFSLAQIVTPLVLAFLPLVVAPIDRSWMMVVLLAMIGYLLPGLVVDRLVSRRQQLIQNGLPDALDLMIVCLESGSSMDQAIIKVSEELSLAYPALAEELRLVVTETRAGKPRLEAFRNLAARTGVEDVRSLVAMLVQTDRFGTSVAQALRTHAETSRVKRRQRAEERAAKIGVKLVFPLVFCLFPAFFVVTLGPAVVKFVRVMFGEILGQ